MLMNRELHVKATSSLVGGVERRRDVWPSKEEAYAVLKGRGAWRAWEGRVLGRFVVSLFLVLFFQVVEHGFILGWNLGTWLEAAADR